MHDFLYANQRGENQGQFSPANLKRFAGELKLGAPAFEQCLDRGEDLAAIRQDVATARERGVNATPVFFVNGQRFPGRPTLEGFVQVLDAELAKLGR